MPALGVHLQVELICVPKLGQFVSGYSHALSWADTICIERVLNSPGNRKPVDYSTSEFRTQMVSLFLHLVYLFQSILVASCCTLPCFILFSCVLDSTLRSTTAHSYIQRTERCASLQHTRIRKGKGTHRHTSAFKTTMIVRKKKKI